jgi:hypothetical protein
MKRYLVTRAIDDGFTLPPKPPEDAAGFLLSVAPGNEIDLDEDVFALVNAKYPGALVQMDSKTKRDWEPAD